MDRIIRPETSWPPPREGTIQPPCPGTDPALRRYYSRGFVRETDDAGLIERLETAQAKRWSRHKSRPRRALRSIGEWARAALG